MSLALFFLIQAQEPRRLSITVIVSSILVFLIGVSLLVYFFRRYKKTERESQDEWDRPGQSLFGAGAPAFNRSEAQVHAGISSDLAKAEREARDKTESGPELEPEVQIAVEASAQELKSKEIQGFSKSAVEPGFSQRPTEIFSSERREPESAERDAIPETSSINNDARAPIETAQPKVSAETKNLGADQTEAFGSLEQPVDLSVSASEPTKAPSQTELLGARVESAAPRELFESGRTAPIVHRQPWEPPTIEPLKPRVQPSGTQSAPPETRTQILVSEPALSEGFNSSHTNAITEGESSSADIEIPTVAKAAGTVAATRIPAGSILGIPAERSRAPLVLGSPSRARDEIGALSNYGRDVDGGGGHGGTIALAVVVLLLGGAIAAYMFVPSINSRVNAMAARARGIDTNPPPAAEQPKARVFPARNEANKNIVKARGAVDNISEEMLNGLSVEVSLERGNDAPPELRRVPVNPAQLAPKQRGVFEFQYDGNRATGFGGYRIVRLLSGEEEVKFTTPRVNG